MSAVGTPLDTIQPKKYGIAIIANDRVIDWLLPFLESYIATSASIPLYLIPYDDNLARTRQVAAAYGVEVVSLDSGELDALARRLYPLNPGHRRRLRKLLALTLPLDEVIYLDVDVILLQDFTRVLGHIEAGKTEFIVASRVSDYIYNSRYKSYDFLRDALLFNDGFFVTSRSVLSLQDFLRCHRQGRADVSHCSPAWRPFRAAAHQFRRAPAGSEDRDLAADRSIRFR